MKNSKKGFGLVTTIVIAAVLFILTAALLTAAVLSMRLTTENINQRQAYLNAKSALGVVAAYYLNASPEDLDNSGLPVGKEADYFAFDADDGTFAQGFTKVAGLDEASEKKTYVKAAYTEEARALKLTAVAKYMGNGHAADQSLQLSRTYDVGYDQNNRITTAVRRLETGGEIRYVTVHVRPYPGSALHPYLYTWAYGDGTEDQQPNLDRTETLLSGGWGDSDMPTDLQGPQGAMYEEGNGWYYYTLEITDPQIHYFNAIVSKKGALRESGDNHAQTHEMFNLPVTQETYQDVYITLNHKTNDFTDFRGTTLDGKTQPNSLTQYVTSYVEADYTTVHVRMQGEVTDSWSAAPQLAVQNVDGSPLVDKNLTSYMDVVETVYTGGAMQYEGYGWYRINVPTDGDFIFTLTGSLNGENIQVDAGAVSGGTDHEIWVAVNKNGSAAVENDETSANRAFQEWGDSTAGDYTTVNVKGLALEEGGAAQVEIDYYLPPDDSGFTGMWTSQEQPMASNKGGKVQYYNVYMQKYKDSKNQLQSRSYTTYGDETVRAGNSRTCYYEEWYSFKIPTTESYTVAFRGLSGQSPAKETVPVQNMTGNIWITLDTDQEINGQLSDLSVYTFDPEENYAQGTTNVYFRDALEWAEPGGSIYAYSWGTETAEWPGTKMQYDREEGLYYIELASSSPFIIFNDGTQDRNTARQTGILSLQGVEGKILYDNKTATWENYIHPKTQLEQAIQDAVAELNRSTVKGVDADGNQGIEEVFFTVLQGIDGNSGVIQEAEAILQDTSATSEQYREQAETLNRYVAAVHSCSEAVHQARTYLPGYDEYALYHANDIVFTQDSLQTLRDAHKEVMLVYGDSGVSYTEIASSALALQRVMDNMEQLLTGAEEGGAPGASQAIVALMDRAGWTAEASPLYRVRGEKYREDTPVTNVTGFDEKVIYTNSQGYYLYYISFSEEQNTARNVQFTVNANQSVPLDKIRAGEIWVYDNQKETWSKSGGDDSVVVYTSSISGSRGEEKLYQSKTGESFQLVFLYDTTVTYDGASYVIFAGVYPISVRDYPDGINLFSAKAKDFFTNPEQFGMAYGGKDAFAADVGWVTADGTLTSAGSSSSDYIDEAVNFLVGGRLAAYTPTQGLSNASLTAAELEAAGAGHSMTGSNGQFPSFAAYRAESIHFRWVQQGVTGKMPDLTGKDVSFYSETITFACTELSVYETASGALRGSFKVGKAENTGDFDHTIRFYTDVQIHIIKPDGLVDTQKSFMIRSGTYKLRGEVDLFAFNEELNKGTDGKVRSVDFMNLTGGSYSHD